MMRAILFLSLLVPALSAAGECTFTAYRTDGLEIVADKCDQKMCTHAILCGPKKEAKIVFCMARNGQCSGYTADDCKAESDKLMQDAAYQSE